MSSAMKRELLIHLAYWFSFFIFISIVDKSLGLSYWLFWLGGLVGVFLPDIDHLIYVLFVHPHELTSQRVDYLIKRSDFWKAVHVLYDTRSERRGLTFHTIFFQLIFFVLTFLVVSSSGSIFAQGLVLSFALHLAIDQIVDLEELGNLDNWFKNLPFRLDVKQSQVYWIIAAVITVTLGLMI
jgi:hypothetical protein